MSEINKLDNVACPFNPEQYKIKVTTDFTTKVNHDVAAPTGSFPWALIQVYLGQQVRRNSWASPYEYIKLTPGSTGSDGKNIPPQIWVIDKDNEQIWAPEQEDMMACDWELLYVLSFDLKVEKRILPNDRGVCWGYLIKREDLMKIRFMVPEETPVFGTLTNLRSIIGIENIFTFMVATFSNEFNVNTMLIALEVFSEHHHQNLSELFSKNLQITVAGSTYNLGSFTSDWNDASHSYLMGYETSNEPSDEINDIIKLGTLLQQNTDKILHLDFKWS
ncbi:DUF2829 domain-containing protein [Xenorhabdus sp. DI]|uniref:Thoeris anti-defense Tad2 family protein n=1 Tax=Xenorhabdus doucetiae TaxID=351671 RepID=UPI00199EBBC7|nr:MULTISPECIES: MW1434 family type I TA system toxin [unclassified Xenorhabdus]MBD2783780.1 DUF2829 domain-containing protein [Xenorhabdus sp. 3]MBD2788214.1 DUF2829 domain-containing protein [Xenorhabdus sp. DI]